MYMVFNVKMVLVLEQILNEDILLKNKNVG